ncbi:MAG: GNAT family N-acetyltransferase [Parvibaculales bacterium]
MIAPTARLNFEPIAWHHAPLFHRLNADPQAMRYFPAVLSVEETDVFIARIIDHRARHGFGLEAAFLSAKGAFAGFIGLLRAEFDAPFTPAVEIGWRLAPEFWGQGLAPEGARAALACGFDELRLGEIVSFTARANAASMRVMEKIGMHHDPQDDFDHPALADDERLRAHVLYRITAQEFHAKEPLTGAQDEHD